MCNNNIYPFELITWDFQLPPFPLSRIWWDSDFPPFWGHVIKRCPFTISTDVVPICKYIHIQYVYIYVYSTTRLCVYIVYDVHSHKVHLNWLEYSVNSIAALSKLNLSDRTKIICFSFHLNMIDKAVTSRAFTFSLAEKMVQQKWRQYVTRVFNRKHYN